MISKKDFTKLAKKIIHSDSAIRKPKVMHPERDWGIGLAAAVIILGSSVYWSGHLYQKYQNTSVTERVQLNSPTINYREAQVKSAIDELLKRDLLHQSLIGTVPSDKIQAVEVSEVVEDKNVDNELATSTTEQNFEGEETVEEEAENETEISEKEPTEEGIEANVATSTEN